METTPQLTPQSNTQKWLYRVHLVNACLITLLLVGAFPLGYQIFQTTKTSKDSSTEVLNILGTTNSLLGNTTTKKDGTVAGVLDKLGKVAEEAAGTTHTLGEVAEQGKETIKGAGETKKRLDTLLDQVATANVPSHVNTMVDNFSTLPTHINGALDATKDELEALKLTTTATGNLLNNPVLLKAIGQVGDGADGFRKAALGFAQVEDDVHLMIGPKSCETKKCKTGRFLIKYAVPILQGGYYGTGAYRNWVGQPQDAEPPKP